MVHVGRFIPLLEGVTSRGSYLLPSRVVEVRLTGPPELEVIAERWSMEGLGSLEKEGSVA
jgi:hypothetical protein